MAKATVRPKVLSWLNNQRVDRVFSPTEVAEETKQLKTSVNNCLLNLKEKGLVVQPSYGMYKKVEVKSKDHSYKPARQPEQISLEQIGEAIMLKLRTLDKLQAENNELWRELQECSEQRDRLQEKLNSIKMESCSRTVSVKEVLG